ncbi:MAG: MBL fold metallo-hydrolase, partial [Thiomonas sp.]
SKILFSGDLGVSLLSGAQAGHVITNLQPMPHGMEAFHRRYMVSSKILKLWVNMVRKLDIAMIAPQHGAPLAGPAIGQLLDWLDGLACGIDLMGPGQYQIPRDDLVL